MAHRKERGFTLIELLVVVAIIAIVASIALVNYLSALDRAKQKRTIADIRMIAQAWEARAADMNGYVAAGYSFPGTEVSYESLSAALTPTYTKKMPRYDAWDHEYDYGVESGQYAIRSPGRDGQFVEDAAPGAQNSPDCDIVFSNGSFICYPGALQEK